MLVLEDIHYSTRVGAARVPVLRAVHFRIEPHEIVAVISRQPSSKQAFLRLLNGLMSPNRGRVCFQQRTLAELKDAELRQVRQQMGYAFQSPNLLASLSVYDNLALPLKLQNASRREIDQQIRPLLEMAQLTHKSDLLPRQLSNVQKQQINILRALAHRPKLLVCEDITQSFDSRGSFVITKLLQAIAQTLGPAILFTSNDLELIKHLSQRVVILDQGTIVEERDTLSALTHPVSQLAKEFIKYHARQEMPIVLQQRLETEPGEQHRTLLRLSFLGSEAQTQILTETGFLFSLQFNIIQAHLERIQDQEVGVMVIEVQGAQGQIEPAMHYLQQAGLYGEILGYVASAA